MYTNTEPQTHRDYQGEYRGRGRGGRYYGRGRGRGRSYWDNRDSRSYWDSRDTSKIMCFRCDKIEHYAATCPDRLLKLQEATESKDEDEAQEADALMMHEIVYLNERNVKPKEFESSTDGDRIWYLDNEASNHMTRNRSYFNTIDDTITGKVQFGDDSRIDIKGKGSILFMSQDKKRKILADVYFIPELNQYYKSRASQRIGLRCKDEGELPYSSRQGWQLDRKGSKVKKSTLQGCNGDRRA